MEVTVIQESTEEYLKIMNVFLLPWIIKNYEAMKVIFVQESSADHGSQTVQTFLKRVNTFCALKI